MVTGTILGVFGGWKLLLSLFGLFAFGIVAGVPEDAWPEFEIPEGVGDGHEPAAPAQPAQPQQPQAAQPGQQPHAQQPPAAQPQNADGTGGQPAQQPQQQPGRQLPDYRVEAIRTRNELTALKTENDRFKNVIAQALGINPANGQQVEQPDPRTTKLRETIFGLIPELKEFIDKKANLLRMAEAAPVWQQQNESYWQNVATRTLSSVFDSVAKVMLGEGKTGKDLEPEFVEDLQDSFLKWCERDRTGQRIARYEGQDPTLVSDFLKAFSARYVDPVRRSASATVQQRGQVAQQLPVSGPAGMPAASQPPQTNLNDEDAVHGRGWQVAQQMRTQQ